MNQNLTELVMIMDRSGSMCGMESDTIGGFNSMIAKQKKLPGEVNVTTVLFDDHVRLLHDRIPLDAIRPMTDQDYVVGGCTALYDAVGSAIDKIVGVQRIMGDQGAGHVQFVIITDGMENSSRHYTAAKIREMINTETEKYNWDFIFLGANMDAITAAADIGIRAERAVEALQDSQSYTLQYEAISEAVANTRMCAPCCANQGDGWKQKVEADTLLRGRKRR